VVLFKELKSQNNVQVDGIRLAMLPQKYFPAYTLFASARNFRASRKSLYEPELPLGGPMPAIIMRLFIATLSHFFCTFLDRLLPAFPETGTCADYEDYAPGGGNVTCQPLAISARQCPSIPNRL